MKVTQEKMDMTAQTSTANVNLEESLRKLVIMAHLRGGNICQAWAELLEAEGGSKEEMLKGLSLFPHLDNKKQCRASYSE